MLPDLDDQFIDETFGGVLHTANQSISSSDIKKVYDGYGNETPISISKNAVKLGTVSYALSAKSDGSALIYNDGKAEFQSLLNSVYPIGSVYFSVAAGNPSTIFGGTWTQIGQGRFLVGVGTGTDSNAFGKAFTSGENGGEYRHTQNVAELVPHKHEVFITQSSQNDDNAGPAPDVGTSFRAIGPVNEKANGLTTLNVGGGQPFNVTPPSFGVYMWQRTN
jgi:hypothetical protein